MRTSADIYTDFSQLAELKRESRRSDTTLKEAARQFEAMFLQMVLKQMRQASPGDPIFDSDRSHFYQEMHDRQLALHLSKGGSVGIADMIVRQLGGRSGAPENGRPLDAYRARPQPTAAPAAQGDRPPLPVSGTPASPRIRKEGADGASSSTRPAQPAGSGPEKFDTPGKFIQALLPEAKRAAAKIGVDPRMLLAQAALETGWGKKILQRPGGGSSHNLFNIKAGRNWRGDRVQVGTLEYIGGAAVRRQAQFRAYENYRESFEDYVALLHQPRYAKALSQAGDPEKYIEALQESGYATDPDYASKILAIYRRQILAAR